MKRLYAIIPIGVALILILALFSFNYPKEDFSTYNTQWNGCSELDTIAKSSHPSTVFNANDLKGQDRGVLVLLNPNKETGFSQDEISTIGSFVKGGGSLFLANDFGNANDLLDGLGIGAIVRFNGSLLLDNYSNWAGPAYPLIYTFANSSVTAGVGTLYLNYATVLDVSNASSNAGNGASNALVGNLTVLAKSSPASYLEAGPSGGATASNSTLSARPVLASLTYGQGKIVLCSDPSVFVNGMIDNEDNTRLFANAMANLTNNDPGIPLLFDESHRTEQPLLTVAYLRVNTDDTLKYLTIISVVGAFAAIVLASTVGRRERTTINHKRLPLSREAMIRDVEKRHPGWSKRQITRLLESTRVGKRKE